MTDATIEQKKAWIAEARRLLELFHEPFWGATASQTDEMHLTDYCETIAKTRKHFDLPEETAMHAVMGEADIVYAFTGNAPNSGDRARALVGFIKTMPFLLDAAEALMTLEEEQSARVSELLEHNSTQLMENRAQLATIRKLQAQVSWLMDQIPGAQVMA